MYFKIWILIMFIALQLKGQQIVLDGTYVRKDSCATKCLKMPRAEWGYDTTVFKCESAICLTFESLDYLSLERGINVFKLWNDTSELIGTVKVFNERNEKEIRVFDAQGLLIRLDCLLKDKQIRTTLFKVNGEMVVTDFMKKEERFYREIQGEDHLYRIDKLLPDYNSMPIYYNYVDSLNRPVYWMKVKGDDFIWNRGRILPKGLKKERHFSYYENGEVASKTKSKFKESALIYKESIEYFPNGNIQFYWKETLTKSRDYELDSEGFVVWSYPKDSIKTITNLFGDSCVLAFSDRKPLKHLPSKDYFSHVVVTNGLVKLSFILYETDSLLWGNKAQKGWRSKQNCIAKEDYFKPFLQQSEYYFILTPGRCWPSDYSLAEKAFLTKLKSK